MQCPSCQNTDSRVLESRSADSGRSVRRRRECLNCDFRFTTYERVETTPITVLKKSGAKELFNRSKIINGLSRACEKTIINASKIEFIVDEMNKIFNFDNKKSPDISGLFLLCLLVVLWGIPKCDSKEESYKCQGKY